MTRIVGIGVDLCPAERFRRILDRYPDHVSAMFSADEVAYCSARRRPEIHFAARWAAKEAAMKCLGDGIGAFEVLDFAVERTASGRPELLVSGGAARTASELGIGSWQLSMSHTDDLAQAFVIACG